MKNSCSQVFNIVADKPYTIKELATAVSNEFNIGPNIIFLSQETRFFMHIAVTIKRRVFLVGLGLTLQQGIKRMADWAKNVGARQSMEFNKIEIQEKLPDGWLTTAKQAV